MNFTDLEKFSIITMIEKRQTALIVTVLVSVSKYLKKNISRDNAEYSMIQLFV